MKLSVWSDTSFSNNRVIQNIDKLNFNLSKNRFEFISFFFFFFFENFCAIFFIGGAYSILTKAEIKLKTDRISFERRKQGINRAKTFWPENRSRGGYGWHWEVWRGFRQQTVWTGFWPVILLTPVIVHGVDTFSPIELVVFAPFHLHFPRLKKK